MWGKIVLLGGFIVLLSSCSRSLTGKTNSSYHVKKELNNQGSVDNRVVVKSSNTNKKGDKSWLEIAENADESSEIGKFDNPSTAYKEINLSQFTTREMQHVSSSNYNPFDSKGEMFFDLKRMRREFHYPAQGHLLSDYGNRGRGFHSGVDIKANNGDNIYAAFDGVVRMSTYYGGYGNVIVVRHYNGLETVYSHNSKNLVLIGDNVKAGDVIAYAGKSGRATGYHVHFEVRVQGQVLNPNLLINTAERKLQDRDLYIYNRAGKVYASNNSTKKRKSDDDDDDKIEVKPQEKVDEKSEVADKKESKPIASKSTESSSSKAFHKVSRGDTLYRIAKANKTTVAELCRLNNIKENAVLSLGQKIKVK